MPNPLYKSLDLRFTRLEGGRRRPRADREYSIHTSKKRIHTLRKTDDATYVVRHHRTDILTARPDGTIRVVLWPSTTTARYLDDLLRALGCHVSYVRARGVEDTFFRSSDGMWLMNQRREARIINDAGAWTMHPNDVTPFVWRVVPRKAFNERWRAAKPLVDALCVRAAIEGCGFSPAAIVDELRELDGPVTPAWLAVATRIKASWLPGETDVAALRRAIRKRAAAMFERSEPIVGGLTDAVFARWKRNNVVWR